MNSKFNSHHQNVLRVNHFSATVVPKFLDFILNISLIVFSPPYFSGNEQMAGTGVTWQATGIIGTEIQCAACIGLINDFVS